MGSAREKILDAADRLFRTSGLEAVTTRRVADRVGVTAMALYRHFRDKEALIEALVAHGFGLWEERLAAAVSVSDEQRPLERALLAYRDFALEEPHYFQLMFLTVRGGVPNARESLRQTDSPAFHQVLVKVRQQIDAGQYRIRDAPQLTLLAWSLAHGLIALHFTGRFGHDERIFRHTYEGTVAAMFALLES